MIHREIEEQNEDGGLPEHIARTNEHISNDIIEDIDTDTIHFLPPKNVFYSSVFVCTARGNTCEHWG